MLFSNNLVSAETDPELKSLHDILVRTETLFYDLKHEVESNSSLDALTKIINVNRNMTELVLLLQLKTKNVIKKYDEELVKLQFQIASKKVPKTKVTKKRSRLFFDTVAKKSSGRQSYYFQRDGSRHQNSNLDYETISENSYKFLSCLPNIKPWRTSDAESLMDGVFHSVKLEKLDKLSFILRNYNDMSEEKLLALEQELTYLKGISSSAESSSRTDFLLKEPSDRDFNWDWISKKYLKNRFTSEECKQVWNLIAKPSISKHPWTPEEDLFLRQVALENSLQNWAAVNEQLPKCRSEFVCFVRYQNVFKKKRRAPVIWTSQENMDFERAMKRSSFSFSDFVSKFIPRSDKLRHQVVTHFKYRQRMRKKKLGLFSKRERFLISSFAARGYSYGAIAQILRSRTATQIKDYHLALKAKHAHGKWSTNEIQNLLKAVKYLGEHNWARISKSVKGRSPTQCRQKFSKLKLKNKEKIENYFSKNIKSNKIKIARIKKFLSNERQVKLGNSTSKRKSVDWKIESYFVKNLQEKMKSEGTNDEKLFSESIFSLLKYLNFNIPPENEFPKEIFTWLTRDLASSSSTPPFDDIFKEHFSPVRITEFKCCGRYSSFSKVVSKYVNVLPVSRCTINGFNTFSKNYESFAKSNENLNFSDIWKKIDARLGKRKDFLEAKIQWYRILKSMFYWPIKLKLILPEELLKK